MNKHPRTNLFASSSMRKRPSAFAFIGSRSACDLVDTEDT